MRVGERAVDTFHARVEVHGVAVEAERRFGLLQQAVRHGTVRCVANHAVFGYRRVFKYERPLHLGVALQAQLALGEILHESLLVTVNGVTIRTLHLALADRVARRHICGGFHLTVALVTTVRRPFVLLRAVRHVYFVAIGALDAVGPELGIEISKAGLIRLVRMISDEREDVLSYRADVNGDLRRVLGLGSALPVTGSADENREPPLAIVRSVFFRTAWANATAPENGPDAKWVWQGKNAEDYIEGVKTLLRDAGDSLSVKIGLSEARHRFFQSMVLSAAWAVLRPIVAD